MNSPMLWEPIRYLETCPSSDGAIALVISNEEQAKKGPRKPACQGAASRQRCGCPVVTRSRRRPARSAPRRSTPRLIKDPWNDIRPPRSACPSVPAMWLESPASPPKAAAGRSSIAATRSSAAPRSTRRAACCARTRSARRYPLGEAALRAMGRAGAPGRWRQERARARVRQRTTIFRDVDRLFGALRCRNCGSLREEGRHRVRHDEPSDVRTPSPRCSCASRTPGRTNDDPAIRRSCAARTIRPFARRVRPARPLMQGLRPPETDFDQRVLPILHHLQGPAAELRPPSRSSRRCTASPSRAARRSSPARTSASRRRTHSSGSPK